MQAVQRGRSWLEGAPADRTEDHLGAPGDPATSLAWGGRNRAAAGR